MRTVYFLFDAALIDRLKELPEQIQNGLATAITVLISLCGAIGLLVVIVGAIQWATGWDERGGKRSVVKGIVLIIISIVAGGSVLAGYLLI